MGSNPLEFRSRGGPMTLRWILALALLLAPACALVEDARLPAPCDPPCESPLVCNDLTGQCVDSFCGNGKVEAGEACDSGGQNSDSTPGACRKNCILAGCGDSVIDPGEACDDGNRADGDYCSATCVHDTFFNWGWRIGLWGYGSLSGRQMIFSQF